MRTAIIIEDEPGSRTTLRNFLAKYGTGINLIGEADCVQDGIELIRQSTPDLIFMDIHLPDGNGFDVLNSLPSLRSKIIFVTAYDDYAIKAFKYSTVDYLLKPFDPLDLMRALNRYLSEEIDHSKKQNAALLGNKETLNKMALPTSDGLEIVTIEDLEYCSADNNYTYLHFNSGNRLVVSKTLKHFDELLPNKQFFRIHQSHLIQLAAVQSYSRTDGGTVKMKSGELLPVSRRKKESLEKRLKSMR